MPPSPQFFPETEVHSIRSRFNNETYQISVMQPLLDANENAQFPVLYATDANFSFDVIRGIALGLQTAGHVCRFILVGIGYPGKNPFAGDILRCRDLSPPGRREISDLPRTSFVAGVSGIPEGQQRWNGANEFLAFVQRELVPFIDNKYSTKQGDRAYFGHSLGGGFGLHALFSQTSLFNRYIISSPGICWEGDAHGIAPAEKVIGSGKRLDAKVFMSVGGLEEFEPQYARSQFCSSFYRLAALLRRSKIPGLEFSSRLFPDETHASVLPIAFTHGVQAIFGPADVPPIDPSA